MSILNSPIVNSNSKIKISGFNNLTKILSFNLYDFCITLNDKQKEQYINFINEKYNAKKITEIARNICNIIEANILNESLQDYEPVGASTMTLMSDIKGSKWEDKVPAPQYNAHLDKSHITAHTYPDASDPQGICSFRVDIDVATCGDIIPLNAINYLFESFECDVVYVDYVVRGFTRTVDGKKIYCDHYFNSIQDFIKPEIISNYQYRQDINLAHENIWQSKFMVKSFGPERYLLDPSDAKNPIVTDKMKLLQQEMREVFHLN